MTRAADGSGAQPGPEGGRATRDLAGAPIDGAHGAYRPPDPVARSGCPGGGCRRGVTAGPLAEREPAGAPADAKEPTASTAPVVSTDLLSSIVDSLRLAWNMPAMDADDRFADEAYDGLGIYRLCDLLDGQRYGVELPDPEGSGHRELSGAQIARWDARVDAWAAARGLGLAPESAAEIRSWGYAMEIEGVLVWTDDRR